LQRRSMPRCWNRTMARTTSSGPAEPNAGNSGGQKPAAFFPNFRCGR
jgi:hypothetical protein